MVKQRGITIAGSLIADVFYDIQSYPEEGKLSKIETVTRHVGGSGNIILDLAKMDPSLNVVVSAIIGNDEDGASILNELQQYPNISDRGIVRKGRSSVTHVMNAKDTLQRTFFFDGAASDHYDENAIDWNQITTNIFQLEYLLLMNKVDAFDDDYGTHGAKLLHDAQKLGMLTSIDIVSEQSPRANAVLDAALVYTDICTINELEAIANTGINFILPDGSFDQQAVQEALLNLRDKGVSKWAIIHSPYENYALDCQSGEFVASPSLNLPEGYIMGTTGAGDAYCAGVLYGAYCGWPLIKTLQFAAGSAACSLSSANGSQGLRRVPKIWDLIARYSSEGQSKFQTS